MTDQDGMAGAILMLLNLLNPGRNSDTVQWSTIRSIRKALSNYYCITPQAQTPSVEVDQPSGLHRYMESPTSLRWFERFAIGIHAPLGDVVIQDKAITVDEMKALLTVFGGTLDKSVEQ
eukprot:CAMPEP_0178904484 /NCGR_PEP_ID=MMETSP0786-20121207/5725_1 /TAXON_ID=186022 /ORGANISM="Thalassionema frauenfeldii, Strain CCMP 1798" /LENGTH=118 /DNA_ID=CAMNT_0020575945 /DNA_START=659 /DNA_END=1015 /DNA_ORIENTATION=+